MENETATAAPETAPPLAAPEPRIRLMTRPAPVAQGWIAVELGPDSPIWFLVQPEPSCAACKGGGVTPLEGQPAYCGACVMPLVDEELRKAIEAANEQLATGAADQADSKLERKIEAARARVAEIEKQRDEAIAENACEQEAATAELERLRGVHAATVTKSADVDAIQAAAVQDVDALEKHAREVHAQAVHAANEQLAEELRRVSEARRSMSASYGMTRNAVNEERGRASAAIARAEVEIERLKAGPPKIRKRWDEKLQGPRATLERLERQWRK